MSTTESGNSKKSVRSARQHLIDRLAYKLRIEESFSRLNARVIAMRSSAEFIDWASIFFKELLHLGIKPVKLGYAIINRKEKTAEQWLANTDGEVLPRSLLLPMHHHPYLREVFELWKKRRKGFHKSLNSRQLASFSRFISSLPGYRELESRNSWSDLPTSMVWNIAFFKQGYLSVYTEKPLEFAQQRLVHRFAAVFEQAYVRLLELAKVEAHAREIKIEEALERVRSRAMSMQESTEIASIVQVVHHEMKSLQFQVDIIQIHENNQEGKVMQLWLAAPGATYASRISVPYFDHPLMNGFIEAESNGKPYFSLQLGRSSTQAFYRKYLDVVDLKPSKERQLNLLSAPSMSLMAALYHQTKMVAIRLNDSTFDTDDIILLRRFGQVFEQAYTRFRDLKKAEDQAREAQVETALERVRSASMAMHQTSDLQKVIDTVGEQFDSLNIDNTGGVFIMINREIDQEICVWGSGPTAAYNQRVRIPVMNHPIYTNIVMMAKGKIGLFAEEYSHQEKIEFFKHMFKYPPYNHTSKEHQKEWLGRQGGYTRSCAVSKHTTLFMINHHGRKFSQQENYILQRFANVFEQSYIRFLDLKKAEEQAREAQVEAALEKVRSTAMAMHRSEDLAEPSMMMYDQFKELGIQIRRCGFGIIDEISETIDIWTTVRNKGGGAELLCNTLPFSHHPLFLKIIEKWKKGDPSPRTELHAKDLQNYYRSWNKTNPRSKEYFKNLSSNQSEYFHYGSFEQGMIVAFSGQPFNDSEMEILRRFAKVFEQTYTRFLDLQKAEAQAREAQIESALERIRARTMAMHQSKELAEVASLLFEELKSLEIEPAVCGFTILNKENFLGDLYFSVRGNFFGQKIEFPHDVTENMLQVYHEWKKGKDFFKTILEGESQQRENQILDAYWQLNNVDVFKDLNKFFAEHELSAMRQKQVVHYAFFSHGYLHFSHFEEVAQVEVLKRFAQVFDQTYTRFLDLQKAEVQARQAIRQASLDRVRGQIASMRSSHDLDRITPLIWNELTTLDVPFIRCGVFIIDTATQSVQTYLSDSSGKALAALTIPFESNQLTKDAVNAWKEKQVYQNHWSKEDFVNWTQSLVEQGYIKDETEYQGGGHPPESLHLNFIPFSQGLLYVGSNQPLTENTIDLVKSLSDAFAIAYARYEDFVKLENAKNRIESTLQELRSTQAQLIHSEKMASLGELTAGIAHEIQNPLNFVNNFAEVSSELIAEAKEELNKGEWKEANDILKDILENLEKINHHGQRASSIVRGMLSHSRGASGEKELTDINELCDEYLRLTYHGIRARDKTFNASFELKTDFSLPPIRVVRQEIGRVLLNLMNNAFQAIVDTEDPQIVVSTKEVGQHIEIAISDNGPGIPMQIRDKIFQPFFTTKPTGHGTGLGLSMSYDIIMAHGGDIYFESNSSGGATFLILLPKNEREM